MKRTRSKRRVHRRTQKGGNRSRSRNFSGGGGKVQYLTEEYIQQQKIAKRFENSKEDIRLGLHRSYTPNYRSRSTQKMLNEEARRKEIRNKEEAREKELRNKEAYMRTPKGKAEYFRNYKIELLSETRERLRKLKSYPQQIEELEKKIIETQQEHNKAMEEVKKDEITIRAYNGYLRGILQNLYNKLVPAIRNKSRDIPELETKYKELSELIQSLEGSIQKRSWWKSEPKQPEIDRIVGPAIEKDKIIRESKEKIIEIKKEIKKEMNRTDIESLEQSISNMEKNVQDAINQVSQFENQPKIENQPTSTV